ncbi:Dot/Icm T4SS effector kinase LegK1 [Legionella shakespearei]|uniref:Serine/threonine-protein kinase n=1 Tax=Legionella shakespearei DSM 23087 TaxID=1122169 RepID=A0A0W0YW72_9GAMM|nr:Dot/Icm T4SS effector kinase LegK1 [Legionella shakespearei]KTD60943.1 serine/threonine-protein kinase [Legionella shakespearei DSM 23087]
MVRTVALHVRPTHLTSWSHDDILKREALNFLLHNGKNNSVWHADASYESTYKSVKYNFTFSQSIIKLPPRKGKDRSRYKIFDPSVTPKGKGGYGITYPLTGSITFQSADFSVKISSKKVVKVQEHPTNLRLGSVYNEYNALNKAGHLNACSPVFSEDPKGKKSYLIMDCAKGIPLEKILHPEKYSHIAENLPELTVEKRIELSLAILQAIKTQVTDRGLIHRDIKPGNILVDLNTSPPTVTVIDYGFAITMEHQDYRKLGTRAYRAPESFVDHPVYTSKADIYSAGRLLSYLWGDDYHNYYIDRQKSPEYIKSKSTNEQLFSLSEIALFLGDKEQQEIRSCLASMIEQRPEKRSSLDETIRQFSEIKAQYSKFIPLTNEPCYSSRFERQLDDKLSAIHGKIRHLRTKEYELRQRGHTQTADAMKNLVDRLSKNTEYLQSHRTPVILDRYQNACLREIDRVKDVFEEHRNIRWLIAEVATAIGLLGVGYLVALGINYHQTGRLGLFAQTQSSRLLDDFKDTVSADFLPV